MKILSGCLIEALKPFVKFIAVYMLGIFPFFAIGISLSLIEVVETGSIGALFRLDQMSQSEFLNFLLNGIRNCVPFDVLLDEFGEVFQAIKMIFGIQAGLDPSYVLGTETENPLKEIAVLEIGGTLCFIFLAFKRFFGLFKGIAVHLAENVVMLLWTVCAFCVATLLVDFAAVSLAIETKMLYIGLTVVAIIIHALLLGFACGGKYGRTLILFVVTTLLNFAKILLLLLFCEISPGLFSPIDIWGCILAVFLVALLTSALDRLAVKLTSAASYPFFLLARSRGKSF